MLNAFWQFDCDEMDKPSHDFEKYWDACFYGTAVEGWSHCDRKALTPVPSLWDPLNILFDHRQPALTATAAARAPSGSAAGKSSALKPKWNSKHAEQAATG